MTVRIELVDPAVAGRVEALAGELGTLLVDSVAGGASVGFLDPLDPVDACRWWLGALPGPGTLTWVAREGDGRVIGVVRLTLVPFPNGAHRAEVGKLLVHSTARGRGVARMLMDALEAEARRRGRWLLVLDTQTGSHAEAMYERWGWQRLGVLADHAAIPDGRLAPTTFLSRRL